MAPWLPAVRADALTPPTHAPPDRSTTRSPASNMASRTATRKSAQRRDSDTRAALHDHASAPSTTPRTGAIQVRDFGALNARPAYHASPRKARSPIYTAHRLAPMACCCLHWPCMRLCACTPASVLRCTALGRAASGRIDNSITKPYQQPSGVKITLLPNHTNSPRA